MGCPSDDGGDGDTDPGTTGTTSTATTTSSSTTGTTSSTSSSSSTTDPSTSSTSSTSTTSTETGSESSSGTEGDDPGPMVDVSDPQLYSFDFSPSDADAEASMHDETQLAFLDTNATPIGRLVVYLHGAGAPSTCGSGPHGTMLAEFGFHVFSPCFVSDYGVGNCGDDIGGCRLEAFEGVDHSDVIDIGPPDSIETRVVRGLEHLQAMHPGGDWQYFIRDGAPRWDRIVVSGISHGASTSGVVGMNRDVDRVVSLSGPLDGGQAWLLGDPITPIDRFFAFTHTGDDQHEGHLDAFADLGLPGDPVTIDDMDPPYGGSHRIVSSAQTDNGHGATQAGGSSPVEDDDSWTYLPVWRLMYGADE